MLQSNLFPTATKTKPKDAIALSHIYLVQAGYINQLAAGIWTLLPLGFRVYKKIEQIIQAEMDAIGGQELLLPTLQPKEIWQKSGRWDKMDPPLFKLKDRHGKELALGPTHEEVMTEIAKTYIYSYKQLPLYLYQIQNKFRNEARATGGLLRVREFMMKDLYSFHRDDADLFAYYQKVAGAYKNIFSRCGLEVMMVAASSGSIGGSVCHEFMALAATGEDQIKYCRCGFASNAAELKSDLCPQCKNKLQVDSAIEVGHIFQLGTTYSQKMSALYVNETGQKKPLLMGCYGIGIGRLLATIVEAHHDQSGIIWPQSVAPFKVHLLSLAAKTAVAKKAKLVYSDLLKQGVAVLYDDRPNISAGEKFADADLLGIPYRLVVSKKTGEKVELKKRGEKKVELVKVEGLINKLT